MPLVTGADLLERLGAQAVHALPDVRGLLLEVDEHLALVGVEADVVRREADLARRLAHDGLVVDLGLGGDLAKDHDHVGLGGGLAGDLRCGGVVDVEFYFFIFFVSSFEGQEVRAGGKKKLEGEKFNCLALRLFLLLLLLSFVIVLLSLSSYLGVGVLLEARIEDGVGDLCEVERDREEESEEEKEKKKKVRAFRRDRSRGAINDRTNVSVAAALSPPKYSFLPFRLSFSLFQLLTWSASLSGWPSLTDSEVKRKVSSSAICCFVFLEEGKIEFA